MNAVLQEIQRTQNGRDIEPIPDFILDQAETNKVFVFNVWPKEQRIDYVPGLGAVTIPACPLGAKHSPAFVVPGVVFEHYDSGDGKMQFRSSPARSTTGRNGRRSPGTVDDILKPHAPRGTMSPNLLQWGVFAAAGETPTSAEIAQAHNELKALAKLFVSQADAFWLEGDKGKTQINQIHREMCSFLKLKKVWLEEEEAPIGEECPLCAGSIKKGVSICIHCKQRIDAVGLAEFRAPKAKN